MTSTYKSAPDLGRPVERHKLTKSAQAARDAMTGRRKREAADLAAAPKRERLKHSGAVPANARKLADAARDKGFVVVVSLGEWVLDAGKANERRVEAVQVMAKHDRKRVGFRAVWAQGKAAMGLWYDGRTQAATRLPDDAGVSEVTRRLAGV